MNKRTLNILLCVIFLALLIAMPVHNLLFTEISDNSRGQGFTMASYVMLFLFGSLAMVFGYRAISGTRRKQNNDLQKGLMENAAVNLLHEDCLDLLADPSTQNILEKLGYEYSASGHVEYRKSRPDFVPLLVRAIVAELAQHSAFPAEYRDRLPQCGDCIRSKGGNFVFMDIDKPSVVDEYVFPTAEAAAQCYVRKNIDPYWHQSQANGDTPSPYAAKRESVQPRVGNPRFPPRRR